MKKLFLFVTSILAMFAVQGQKQLRVKETSNQIDSANHYVYVDIEKAAEFYTLAQEAAKEIQNDTLLARTYVGFAIMARLQADYPKSLEWHRKALNLDLRLGQQRFVATDYHNIAYLFRHTGDYEEAKKYYLKGMRIREQIQDSTELDNSYTELGIIYRRMKQLDSMAYYYEKAYEVATQQEDKDILMRLNGNQAVLEYNHGNYQKAIELNLLDIPYIEEKEENESLITRYNNVAKSYEKLNDYPRAIEYIDKALKVAERERYLKDVYKKYVYRSRLEYELNDYKSALDDYRKYKKYRDTVMNLEQIEKFEEQKYAFELERQQLADSLQFVAAQEKMMFQNQVERERKNLFLITTILLLCIGSIGWYLLKNKRKLTEVELEKQQLEADLLQEKLQSTEKEAERIVAENQYRLEQKKNLLSHLEQLRKIGKDQRIVKELNTLALSMNLQLTSEEQNLFFEENRDQFPLSFEEQLIQRYPELTKGERELCKFIRINKSIKEIMELKGVSSSSVRSMRYRIRKKLNLSREQELEQVLRQI